jgi:type II secretory pathway predicted ATPase ExeA
MRTSAYTRDVEAALHALSAREPLTVLTGEEGTGKTTVCRVLAGRFSARTTGTLLAAPLSLNDVASIASSIVIVDEAHNLATDVLAELIRRAAARARPTQLVLAGRPQLSTLLDDTNVRNATLGVAVRTLHLSPLAGDQIKSFVERRWWSAQGGIAAIASAGPPSLARSAADAVARISQGNPRIVSTLADAALQLAVGQRSKVIDVKQIERIAVGLGLLQAKPPRRISRRALNHALAASAALAAILVGSIELTSSRRVETPAPTVAQPPPASALEPVNTSAHVMNVTDIASLRKNALADAERLSATPDVIGLMHLQDAAKTWDADTHYTNHAAVEQLLVELDRITNDAREKQLIEDGRQLRQAAQPGESQ